MAESKAPRSLAVFRALARGAAVGCGLLGLLILGVGWGLDVTVLRSVLPGLPPTAPPTALALSLAGTALGLLLPQGTGPSRRAAGLACAGAVLALGLLALLQHATGALRGAFPATSLETAVCLVLLGPALLLLERRAGPRLSWADLLVIPAFLIALVVFNGYLHDAYLLLEGQPPDPVPRKGMGLYSAAALLVLCAGILGARPGQGLMGYLSRDSLGGFIARRLIPVALAAPPLLGTGLETLRVLDLIGTRAESTLFSTTAVAGSAGLVLLACRALDLLDAERQRATAAQQASEALYRALLETAPDPVLTVDAAGHVRFVNAQVARVFGYTREELLGQPLEVLVPESLRALHRQHRAGYLAAPRVRHMAERQNIVGRRKDGSEVPLEVTLSPVPTAEGLHVTAILRDSSARRELERLREEYVGLISHDLRSPLQNISLRTQLLRRALHERGLAREEAAAEGILQSAQRMSGMIEELLEGVRLESGQVELRREPMDLVHFLEEVLERDVPPDARARFRLEVVGPVPPVPVDSARVERVVTNLLTNALKHCPPGTSVTVRLVREPARVVVSVRDSGPGLKPEDAAHLFEKYYRTHAGRKTEGFGLGLYSCRLIVEAHGGHIWVESTPGQGATFAFSLPLAVPPAEPRGPSPEQPQESHPPERP